MKKFDVDEPEISWLDGWSLDRQAQLFVRGAGAGISEELLGGTARWLTFEALNLPSPSRGTSTERVRRMRYREVLRQIGPPTNPRKGRSGGRGAKKAAAGTSARRIARSAGTATLVALATPIILDDVEPAPELARAA